MTLPGKNSVPQEHDMSSTIQTLVFIAIVELLLPTDLGMSEATFEHDSVALTTGHGIAWHKWCTQST